jgi:hypothetical protein
VARVHLPLADDLRTVSASDGISIDQRFPLMGRQSVFVEAKEGKLSEVKVVVIKRKIEWRRVVFLVVVLRCCSCCVFLLSSRLPLFQNVYCLF